MKTPLHKVLRAATSGPLVAVNTNPENPERGSWQLLSTTATTRIFKSKVLVAFVESADPRGAADAALLAHCRNTYVEALEMLKAIESPLRLAAKDLRAANKTGTPSYLDIHANDIHKLITKMETVK